jgi:membrane-bound lytic murein transglycosylase B
MLIKVMRFLSLILFLFVCLTSNSYSDDNFDKWLLNYKQFAVNQGVTKKTVDEAFRNTKLLKRIIKYDRNQPEFIEKTKV